MNVIPILREVINFLHSNEVGCYRVDSHQESSRVLGWTCASKEVELKMMKSGMMILDCQDRHFYKAYPSIREFEQSWHDDILLTIGKG